MDPFSAMIFAIVVSGVIVHTAWDAGVDQAKAEARHAAEAIRKDLQKRRKVWAKQLNDRLENGRTAGPATALWWGWAAMRTAKAVYRGLKREPRTAEKAIGGPTGPFQRIFGAAWRGARYARDEARRQREAREKAARTPVGVCSRCGAVVANAALAWALTRLGRQEQMCAGCRASVEAQRKADQDVAAKANETEQDVPDADVIHEPTAAISRPEPNDIPRDDESAGTPPHRATTSPPPTRPAPATTVTIERVDNAPAAQRPVLVESVTRPASNTAPEGERMPRQLVPSRGGVVATRNTAMTRRGGGDSYTHGQWKRATADIGRRLEMLPALLEQMLRSLHHSDAGREQVAGVMAFYQDAVNLIGEVTTMLAEVNRRETPVVEAVTAAGGPSEIPNIPYFREV